MGFFDKIFGGLSKTRKNMVELEELFQGYQPDSEEFYEELEELLVLADVGATTAQRVDYLMRKATWEDRYRKGDEARAGLIKVLSKILNVGDTALKLDTKPSVILMVGVNGVGKTTTIGKLAHQLKEQGKKVLLVAGDTFRAAGFEVETLCIGTQAIHGCIGCQACRKTGRCVFDDLVNVAIEKSHEADGFVFASAVHYASLSGSMTSFMDRFLYTTAADLANKPADVHLTRAQCNIATKHWQITLIHQP